MNPVQSVTNTFESSPMSCGIGPAIGLSAGPMHTLTLVKHGRRYLFRYEAGEELAMLQHLEQLVREPESELDWFDAAWLCHQMGKDMCRELGRLRKISDAMPAGDFRPRAA